MITSEYTTILRLPPGTPAAPGSTFIPSHSPPTVRQLVRDLTLARGRVLYEIHNSYEGRVLGYISPWVVADIAFRYRDGVGSAAQKVEPEGRRAMAVLREMFPRMPEFAALRVVEKVGKGRERCSGRESELEEKVVGLVKDEWTSFEFRMEQVRHSDLLGRSPLSSTGRRETQVSWWRERRQRPLVEEQILETVKPRIREVLRSWLPADITNLKLAALWERHGLLGPDYEKDTEKTTSWSGPETD